MTTPGGPTDDEIEELHQLLLERFLDPVDVFEDDLAHELGLERHLACSFDEWRQARVRYINASECDEDSEEGKSSGKSRQTKRPRGLPPDRLAPPVVPGSGHSVGMPRHPLHREHVHPGL